MTPFYALAIAGAAIIICLLYKYAELYRMFKANEFVQYVDTSGIAQNPPSYIDVWEGKTINFKLDKWDIKIPQMKPDWCFKYLRRFAINYKLLLEQAEKETTSRLDQLIYAGAYANVVRCIYGLSKHFISNKRKFRKALSARSRNDIMFILDISEQIYDYWIYVKKKIALLSNQTTLRKMAGASFADGSCKLDTDGKIYAIPRFESGLNTVQ